MTQRYGYADPPPRDSLTAEPQVLRHHAVPVCVDEAASGVNVSYGIGYRITLMIRYSASVPLKRHRLTHITTSVVLPNVHRCVQLC